MPCYFVSSGVETPMTNQTFDFIWNGLGNKELTDSETSSSSEEGDKTVIDPLEVFALLEFCWIYF